MKRQIVKLVTKARAEWRRVTRILRARLVRWRHRRHGSTIGRVLEALGAARLLVIGFSTIIVLGMLALMMPSASARPTPLAWDEALFTSASAATVTGLVVVNTATELSLIGQIIVLILMQVGGVGFIAFSVLLFRLIGRNVTFQERFLVGDTLGVSDLANVTRLAVVVLGWTLTLEAIGAAMLFLRWRGTMPEGRALYLAVFHAISSYCNAGFDLFTGTDAGAFFGFGDDPFTLGVTGILIVLGGLGVTVLYDIWDHRDHGFLSLHTRLTVVMAVLLTLAGAALIWSDRDLAAAAGQVPGSLEEYSMGLYTVVSARTAGLTLFDLGQLQPGSQLMIAIWMFIGAAPASMAGGVSTSTVAVILVAVYATIRGDRQATAFGRALPEETVRKALAVGAVSTIFVAASTLLLVEMLQDSIFPIAFETVSAFSNTGYSLGVTSALDVPGRLLIAFMMFWGRLGPLTIVVALAQRERPSLVGYPEEAVILG